MDRLGLVAATFSGLSFAELQALAREADAAGFAVLCLPEFMHDALANCPLVTQVTTRLKAATWVANLHLRHPVVCAQSAIAVDYTSRGRFLLGVGVSHRPIVEGVYRQPMDRPREVLRQYVTTVRQVLTGQGYPGAPAPLPEAAYGVPIYLAALSLQSCLVLGHFCDV